MGEAPDPREQEDCPSGEECDWSCDQHEVCALCGGKATGLATYGGSRFCHGDFDPSPTCYTQAQLLLLRAAFSIGPTEMFP